MLAALGRGLFLGGGMIGNMLGGAISGAGAAIGGIAQGAGSAVGGIAQGVGSAVGGAMTPADKVVVNNVGMVGQAAKKKVTGTGTLPAPKKSARPTVNANMPTEKLLVVAVNYLSSIDKTLQDQIKFESQAFNQQVQAEKEASIENKKEDSVFTKLGDKFNGLMKSEDDSTLKSRAGNITKAILGAAGIAALGTLALGAMDDSELARLKSSWATFTEKYDWLIDMASAATGVAPAVGYLFKGWRGAVAGVVVEWLVSRLTGSSTGGLILSALGLGGEAGADPNAAPANQGNTGFDYAMGGVVAGYGAMRGVKTVRDVRGRMATINQTRSAPRAAPSLRGSGFRDPVTGKAASRAAVTAGGGWLSGPKGQRFVAFLSKRFGQSYVAKKLMPLLARVFVGLAITATGVGAIPGILWTLLNVGLALWTVYDLLDAWWDFQDEEDARKDASAANAARSQADASPTTTNTGTTGLIPGAPIASQEQMQNLPPIPADIEKILATIRTRESGGNYGIPHPIGMPNQTASGAYAFIDSSWQGLTKKYGIGTEYPRAYLAPPPIQDAVAAKYVQEILQQAGGDVSKVPLAWYTGNIQGKMSASALATNNGLTPQAYQAKWMADYTGGQYAASSYDSQGASGSTIGNMASAAWDMSKAAAEAIGGIIQAGVGPQSLRSTTDSLASSAPSQSRDNARNVQSVGATPSPTTDNRAAMLASTSTRVQSAIDMGNAESETNSVRTSESSAQTSLRNASNDSKLEAIDPNYPGTGGVDGYLQYYRLAA
jgi:hypothetical protein